MRAIQSNVIASHLLKHMNCLNIIVVPTNGHKYIETSSYTQWLPTCFGQSCRHLQGGKTQGTDTLKSRRSLCIQTNFNTHVCTSGYCYYIYSINAGIMDHTSIMWIVFTAILGQECKRDLECVDSSDLKQRTVWCFSSQCSCRSGFKREGTRCGKLKTTYVRGGQNCLT